MAEGRDPEELAADTETKLDALINDPKTSESNSKDFSRRLRSLELTIVNNTSLFNLEFYKEYFFTGGYYEHFYPALILPGKFSKAKVCNKRFALSGVSGGVMFSIKNKQRHYYLMIGFTNLLFGNYETFIDVCTENRGPEFAYDNCRDNYQKYMRKEGFIIEAVIMKGSKGGDRNIIYKISDATE